ncbi:aspartyl protease family protein [Oceanicaulis sp. MMSF_3324]|uniref:aspartyl protease family protein n=1 Tax=Oceanicaulis sp. MMSF_3324 TaxID=3046702 RepID=UPI00273FC3AC|nr:aspartyl protease family protein [Oceanicaulis sp. MMSF_3324]
MIEHAVRLCASLAGLACATATAVAQPQTFTLERTSSGYFVAPVFLGADGPYPFAPDTGASHVAIAETLAQRHGFVRSGDRLDPVQTLTAEVTAERHILVDLRLGDAPQGQVDAVVTPIATDIELELFGLLGSEAFAGQTVEIDYPNSALTLDAPSPRHADARLDPVRQVLVGQARARWIDEPIAVLVDTGSPVTLVNPVLARRLSQRTPMRVMNVGSVSRIPDTVEVDGRVTLTRFRLGGVCIRGMSVDEAELDVFDAMGWSERPAMIVGLDLLQDTRLIVDYATGRAQIDPGPERWRCRAARSQIQP